MLDTIWDQLRQTSIPELIAVVLAVAYLLLAVKEHIACWYAAFVSTAIFLVLFFEVSLYMDAALQVYYLIMAVYGWYEWKWGDKGESPLPISIWPLKYHVIAISAVAVATTISAVLLTRYTSDQLPWLDSFTTWGAIVTTWMVARKVLDNWPYWLIIDGVSIYMYMNRGLYFTAFLFVLYVIIIGFGWIAWIKSYRQQQTALASA